MPESKSIHSRPDVKIVPLDDERDPWISSNELRRVVSASPADPELLDDIADVRGTEIDE